MAVLLLNPYPLLRLEASSLDLLLILGLKYSCSSGWVSLGQGDNDGDWLDRSPNADLVFPRGDFEIDFVMDLLVLLSLDLLLRDFDFDLVCLNPDFGRVRFFLLDLPLLESLNLLHAA